MAKVLCVLYDDPVDGYPDSYAATPSPSSPRIRGTDDAVSPRLDFTRATSRQRVGRARAPQISRGRRPYVDRHDDKDGLSRFSTELVDADIVISQPFCRRT